MKNVMQKMLSRKFMVSVISMIAGIAALCGADPSVIETVAGCAMTVLPCVIYCITEGKIDAATVRQATDALTQTAKQLGADDAAQQLIAATGAVLQSCENGTDGTAPDPTNKSTGTPS